ncbi:MAG: hypothetical protein M3Y50_05540 [Acidobacteriota bacterium]|nr:hypothetical protein [Acidobacteriota bacterium]
MNAETWFVRSDGGTRYSDHSPKGQCDGKADAAYPGKGNNRHCAFKDVRSLWSDGTYTVTNAPSAYPAWGWIGSGGDTYLIRGSIADGVSYRVGQNGPNSGDYFGLAGDPYGAGIPPPLSGTASQHTRILGGNYAACHSVSAKTQLHGGFGVGAVLNMSGSSYIDIACLDITDFSSCGKGAQTRGCKTNFPLDDFASNGIAWSKSSTHDTLTDVHIHGLANAGMIGPVGDGMTFSYLDILGNAAAGWNADSGNGTTGSGSLLVEHYTIGWNGCAEEYPIRHDVPYGDCTDDNTGGYGDGFGTSTVTSVPGWQIHFDQGSVFYNTQDGLDALHVTGEGSSVTVTRTLAYGNMGQQIKVGGAKGIVTNNQIVTNCNALRQNIPGTPAGYNSRLSDFCRAADAGVLLTVRDGSMTVFENNILYSASATALEVDIHSSCSTGTCLIRQRNNIFIGFLNSAANGYIGGGSGQYSNPLYVQEGAKAYSNQGSSFDGNTTYHPSKSWSCPALQFHETRAKCGDPHLKNESWPLYGYGDMTQPGSTNGSQIPAASAQ